MLTCILLGRDTSIKQRNDTSKIRTYEFRMFCQLLKVLLNLYFFAIFFHYNITKQAIKVNTIYSPQTRL